MVSTNLNSQHHLFAFIFIGPTASGKSGLAHSLVEQFQKESITCEIVNLDAFQIYKELSAGTAKPTENEKNKYNYHCIDLINIHENMDANTFAKKVTECCQEIIARGNIPFCVGGSGLYLRSFLHGLDNFPARDDEFRKHLRSLAEVNGWPWCHKWLSDVDPIRAQELHPNDKTRIERALEIYTLSGTPMSVLRSKTGQLNEQETLFPCYVIHMEPNDEILKERIKQRIPILFNQGWLKEVQQLYKKYSIKLNTFHGFQAIGYKEVLNYIINSENQTELANKNLNISELQERISTLTWQYAKRQGTWNAKEKKDFVITSLNDSECNRLFSEILDKIKKFRSIQIN
ncbi:tRNA (adenosine(37)-N6)-dimethylallyltransferase MiaA [Fluviispira multicolorata]|uniref:tRNA dimethylallyltransferase n=1 Tax=Fluviispira multicolorata TaxID=2654512 RepID=A0A833JGA6_9BACT|nr:tRNA (adenosine(37)-N6)-dimethylallyltransferase MiaA [Fluviispira multicolorata]KAB8033755.1 tRNA (adenosine(37)-N6)-dimethylallyltransferase MiaA [Fluviispira multicolorata]